MKSQTLKALKASIAHWRRMATGKASRTERPQSDSCALCGLFINRPSFCRGCPVAEKAKAVGCNNTPFNDAYFAWKKFGKRSRQFKLAAQAELAFLESLLPKRKS